MKAKGRRVALIFLGLVCLIVATPIVLTWRAVRQERLNTVLIAAAKLGDAKSGIHLLEQGANPNCREKPDTPISPWQTLRDLLQGRHPQDQPDSPTPLALTVGPPDTSNDGFGMSIAFPPGSEPKEKIDFVRALLEHGACADPFDGPHHSNPLFYSINQHWSVIAHLLLAHGAKLTAVQGQMLLAACLYDDTGLVSDLMTHGADVNARLGDSLDQTALMTVSRWGNVNGVKILLALHADVNLKDNHGDTALSRLVVDPYDSAVPDRPQRMREIIRLLQAAGAKP